MSKLARASLAAPFLLIVSLAACSSAPGSPGEFGAPDAPESAPPQTRPTPPMSTPRPAWLNGAVFSAHALGGVIAFDSATGEVRAHVLHGQPVQDLTWDASSERLLVALALAETEGGKLVALTPTDSGLTLSAESPPFNGELRVTADALGVLLVNHFETSSWQLLDSQLLPNAPGRALSTPSGLRAFANAGGRAWLALDTTGYANDEYQDALVRVEHGGSRFSTEPLFFPAPGRPQTRLIRGAGASTWIARKAETATWLEYASYNFHVPQVPEFQRVELGADFGPLVDALVVPTPRSFALLFGGTASHLVSISKDAAVTSVAVPGASHPEILYPCNMSWHETSSRLWIATELGLTAFAATESGFSQVAHLADARGPIVTAE